MTPQADLMTPAAIAAGAGVLAIILYTVIETLHNVTRRYRHPTHTLKSKIED